MKKFCHKLNFAIVLIILVSLLLPAILSADIGETAQILTANDAAWADRFGYSVSISGDYAIMGAPSKGSTWSEYGYAAYIFELAGNSWTQVAKLTPSGVSDLDGFGGSVSISGNYAIVGAHLDDSNGTDVGSAYIFERIGSSWVEVTKLTASDGDDNDQFGYSVSVSGNYAIVGSQYVGFSGSAYVFERIGSTWTEVAKLTTSDTVGGYGFGHSVSISGNYAIVGARLGNDNGSFSGSAFIFDRNGSTWTEVAKLTASDADAGDQFGYSVSVSGNYAIVGAPYDDDLGPNSGSAYIFDRIGSTWTEVAKLTTSDADAGDLFGYSVSISGDYALAGSPYSDAAGGGSGSAYIFERLDGTWTEVEKLIPFGGCHSNQQFGYSVSVDENRIIVGNPYWYPINPCTTPQIGAANIYKIFDGTPSLEISYPNGGEVLTKGEDYTITWNSTDVSGDILIHLYKGGTDSAYFVETLAASDPNDGAYPFNPPDTLADGNDYYIGISAEAGTVWDFSDTFFTIKTGIDITSGLVAYYPFNGNANDASGNGNDGTVYGATLTSDRFGSLNSAYSFTPPSWPCDDIRIPDSDSLDITGDLTIAAWVNITNSGYGYIFHNMVEVSPHDGYMFAGLSDGGLRFMSGNMSLFSTSKLNTGIWKHVAVSLSGTSATIYIDGVPDIVGNVGIPTANTIDQTIGGSNNRNYCFNGLIDDLSVYNRALSEPEIQELYNQGGIIDSDGDGIPDDQDAFPDDPDEWEDTDGDGTGNNADPDDDDDGFTDEEEIAAGTDPLDPNSFPNQPPTTPVLSSPANNAPDVNPKTLVLEWSPSTDPDDDLLSYAIKVREIKSDGSQEDVFSGSTPPAETSFPLGGILKSSTIYTWSIKALDAAGNETESEWWTFNTASMIYGLFVGTKYDDFRGDLSAEHVRDLFDDLPNVYHTLLIASETIPDYSIENGIDFLKEEKIKPGDTLFVYITGHGYAVLNFDETTDTRGDEFITTGGSFFGDQNRLTDDELYSYLTDIDNSVNKWILIDSCKSGGYWGDHNLSDEGDLEKLENTALLASATETGIAPAVTIKGQEPVSMFALALHQGFILDSNGNYPIDSSPQDGNITFTEMADWIEGWVERNPWWEGEVVVEMEAGDPFIFYSDMWRPFFAKTDDFVESLSVGSINSLVAEAMGPYSGYIDQSITFDASGSHDPDGQIVSYEWDFNNDGTYDVNVATPTAAYTYAVEYTGLVKLRVTDNDGLTAIDTASVEVVYDTFPPYVIATAPNAGEALQDGVTLAAVASNPSKITEVSFSIREPNGASGTPIGYEDLPGTLISGKWDLDFDTTQLPDGYYVLLAKAVDNSGNEGWSEPPVPFSIRNWVVLELLPSTANNKAGRTMPVKFALRIVPSVDPSTPFVRNEDLNIRICDGSGAPIYQSSYYGDTSTDYRIGTELYITNFKTFKQPQTYQVQIWRPNNFEVGKFTFQTTK